MRKVGNEKNHCAVGLGLCGRRSSASTSKGKKEAPRHCRNLSRCRRIEVNHSAKDHNSAHKNAHLGLEGRRGQPLEQCCVCGAKQSDVNGCSILVAVGRYNADKLLDLHGQPERVRRVLRRVHKQYDHASSERMMQVVALLAEGFSPKEVASILRISRHTVDFHWWKAKIKLGFRSYVDTVRFSIKRGLIDL